MFNSDRGVVRFEIKFLKRIRLAFYLFFRYNKFNQFLNECRCLELPHIGDKKTETLVKSYSTFKEGSFNKGGINLYPSTPRPKNKPKRMNKINYGMYGMTVKEFIEKFKIVCDFMKESDIKCYESYKKFINKKKRASNNKQKAIKRSA